MQILPWKTRVLMSAVCLCFLYKSSCSDEEDYAEPYELTKKINPSNKSNLYTVYIENNRRESDYRMREENIAAPLSQNKNTLSMCLVVFFIAFLLGLAVGIIAYNIDPIMKYFNPKTSVLADTEPFNSVESYSLSTAVKPTTILSTFPMHSSSEAVTDLIESINPISNSNLSLRSSEILTNPNATEFATKVEMQNSMSTYHVKVPLTDRLREEAFTLDSLRQMSEAIQKPDIDIQEYVKVHLQIELYDIPQDKLKTALEEVFKEVIEEKEQISSSVVRLSNLLHLPYMDEIAIRKRSKQEVNTLLSQLKEALSEFNLGSTQLKSIVRRFKQIIKYIESDKTISIPKKFILIHPNGYITFYDIIEQIRVY
ncbi:hypothetical protein NEFER03_1133 [Nematocida sp. LUAm3]|nr:hypothetical protein NEFER03_1133 [Nematocida sp. LUAm3]KAI5176331.1 hypothetical protein NEFER02_2119 [Nematocida sp. LUAm2]KAI5178238.1 hypothetical protein NEFER01_1405 [Nematocida sp. LUAm1]